MTHPIYSTITASISGLKRNPMRTVTKCEGETLAILNRNEPVFYCVLAKTYKNIVEDLEFSKIIKARANEK